MKPADWVVRQLRRPFVRNVVVVAGGTALAQAITVAFSPVITRLYGPEAFGVLGVFVALVAMIAPVTSLAYGYAVVLPRSDDDARALVKLSLLIAGSLTLTSVAVFVPLRSPIAHALGLDAAAPYLLLLPPVLFLAAIEQVLRTWLIRKNEFRAISCVAVGQALVLGTTKSTAGLIAPTAAVLLVVNAIGQALLAGWLWLAARSSLGGRRRDDQLPERCYNAAALRRVAHEYRDYPLFRAPQVLLNSVSQNIPAILLAALAGPAAAGLYALSRRVLSLPASLVSQSVGTVFLPRVTMTGHRGEPMRPLVLKATGSLALAGLVPFGLVIILGPWLFGLVFGDEWTTAGVYARWMALWLYSAFLNVPSVQVIPLLGMQAHLLAFELVATAVRTGALLAGALALGTDVAAVALFSVSGALVNAALITWILFCTDRRARPGLAAPLPSESASTQDVLP